ncbi:MAG: hypothetical protein WA948_02825 [Pontixanthobacter sp.]
MNPNMGGQPAIQRATTMIATLLLSVVATQIVYFVLSSGGADIARPIIWTVEAVLFLGLAVVALDPMVKQPRLSVIWGAIAMGGVLNVVQVGMGLAMFPPLKDAGEAMAPAFDAVLAGAFFLYFAGKFLFAAAGIAAGLVLLRRAAMGGKIAGILAIISGFAALLVNIYAMGAGMSAVFIGGAMGTAATLFLAIALIAMKHVDLAEYDVATD